VEGAGAITGTGSPRLAREMEAGSRGSARAPLLCGQRFGKSKRLLDSKQPLRSARTSGNRSAASQFAGSGSMVKKFISLIVVALLLFLEVGIASLHNLLPNDDPQQERAASIEAGQRNPAPAGICPVCQFLQISFLLSFILFVSAFRRRCVNIPVHEIAFPALPRSILPSRGPPAF
jgi:hypothetical protein